MPRKKATPETESEIISAAEMPENGAIAADEEIHDMGEPATAGDLSEEEPIAAPEDTADILPPEAFLPEPADTDDVPDFIAFEPGEAVPADPNGYDPEQEACGEEAVMEEGEDLMSPEILLAPEEAPVPQDSMTEAPASVITDALSEAVSVEVTEEGSAVPTDAPESAGENAETEGAPKKRTTRRRSRKTEEQPVEVPEAPEAEKPLTDQQKFYALDFNALDRSLTPEQRQEWNAIYASYRGRSVMTGTIIGIDKPTISQRDKVTGEMKRQEMYCAVVIPYRIRIVIPASEMWVKGDERPDFVLRNMTGARIDFVIIHVDREAGFAIASRRLAMRSRRYYFASQQGMHRSDSRTQCHVLAVGPRRCLVECWGHDLDLTQREIRYTAIPDLRSEYHPGDELDCVVKEYEPEHSRLTISVKEVEPNPFDGADMRHPEGSRRFAVIAGKYAGGVFCNLPDGVVVMCNYSFHYEDTQFAIGDKVIVMLQQYEFGKKQIFGKIVAKW